jgi:tetratricopeptide (TPR) repeat protein
LLASVARADDVPWATGVSDADQAKANALYAEGNDRFAHQDNLGALEKYKAAIAIWDHPKIRFNMAVVLIRLDRILDAADALDAALRYGAQPFSADLYQRVLDDQQLVSGRVGAIEASCTQPDTHVLLDGKPWFTCPGTQKQRVLAGEHILLGEKKEFMTQSRRIVVAGGKTSSETVALIPLESAVKLEYRYPRWIPYTIAGAGAAVALGGLGFYVAGSSQMDKFQADFAMQCRNGCKADLSDQPLLADERDSARLKGKIGIGMMIGGGALAIGGAILAVYNSHARRVLPQIETTQGGATASVGWQF